MRVIHWIQYHKELGNLSTKTGTRLINILNSSGVVYTSEFNEIELRQYKGCGNKTYALWNSLKNLRIKTQQFPDLYRASPERYELEKRISELEDKNRRLEIALANEKRLNSTTNYGSLRKQLIEDNK